MARRRPNGQLSIVYWSAAVVGVLLVSFGVGYVIATQVLFPTPDTAGTGIPVPGLYGDSRAEAEAAVREAGLEVGDVMELPSSQSQADRVLAQAPLPGQQLQPGATVSFAVGTGRPALRVPPLRGLGAATARDLLERAGFEVAVQQVEAREPAGTVVDSEPPAGSERTLPAVVTLRVSVGPPADTVRPPEGFGDEPESNGGGGR